MQLPLSEHCTVVVNVDNRATPQTDLLSVVDSVDAGNVEIKCAQSQFNRCKIHHELRKKTHRIDAGALYSLRCARQEKREHVVLLSLQRLSESSFIASCVQYRAVENTDVRTIEGNARGVVLAAKYVLRSTKSVRVSP